MPQVTLSKKRRPKKKTHLQFLVPINNHVMVKQALMYISLYILIYWHNANEAAPRPADPCRIWQKPFNRTDLPQTASSRASDNLCKKLQCHHVFISHFVCLFSMKAMLFVILIESEIETIFNHEPANSIFDNHMPTTLWTTDVHSGAFNSPEAFPSSVPTRFNTCLSDCANDSSNSSSIILMQIDRTSAVHNNLRAIQNESIAKREWNTHNTHLL